jgi:uncharacterized membrane protein YfcA
VIEKCNEVYSSLPVTRRIAPLNTDTLLLTIAAFLLAGFIKGVIGMGLPTISIALLTTAMGLPAALQIIVMPTLVTNVWQALIGDRLVRLTRRFATLLAGTMIGIWIGYAFLFRTNPKLMTAVLGAVIIVYSVTGLFNLPIMPTIKRERLASPLVGLTTGMIGGTSGNLSMPAIAYLNQLKLPRNDLVQMLGILFSLGTAALGFSLASYGEYEAELLRLSTLAVIPAIAGMLLGQRTRGRLSERIFRRSLFIGLAVMGAHLVWKGLH